MFTPCALETAPADVEKRRKPKNQAIQRLRKNHHYIIVFLSFMFSFESNTASSLLALSCRVGAIRAPSILSPFMSPATSGLLEAG